MIEALRRAALHLCRMKTAVVEKKGLFSEVSRTVLIDHCHEACGMAAGCLGPWEEAKAGESGEAPLPTAYVELLETRERRPLVLEGAQVSRQLHEGPQ